MADDARISRVQTCADEHVAPHPHGTKHPPPRLLVVTVSVGEVDRSIHQDGTDNCHVVVVDVTAIAVPKPPPLDCTALTPTPMGPLAVRTDGLAYSPFVALTALAVLLHPSISKIKKQVRK